MSVRAKFYITTIEPYHGGKGGGTVKLRPVYSADPAHENKTFWDATPTGEISMQINNPSAFDFFTAKIGKEFYVDFSEA
jgi:hypothetical protein